MFAAVGKDDTQKDAESLAARVLKLKIWPDEAGGTVCFHTRRDYFTAGSQIKAD